MKLKQVFLCATALCLAVAPLSGCGSDETASGGGTAEREVVDLGGYEFTWATPWEWNNYPEAGSSDYGDRRLELYEQVEEDYHCTITKIEVNPDTFFDSVNKAAMAGDKFADFIEMDLTRYQTLMKTESLKALSDIEGFDVTQAKFFPETTAAYQRDGKTYGVQFEYQQKSSGSLVFFNKNLLENNNLESPYDLVANDQWTFAKFQEMCKALTKDTDGNNELDQWGVATIDWHANNFEKPFVFANGGSVIKQDDEGKWKFAMLDAPALEALNFLYQLESVDKSLKPAPTSNDTSANIADFNGGKVGFWVSALEMIDAINANIEDEFGIVPLPKGPSATDYVQSDTQVRAWTMLTTNKDFEKASIVMNAISDPVTGSAEGDEELYYEELLANKLNGDEQALEMVKLASEKMVADYYCGVPGMDVMGTAIYSCVRDGSMTPQAAMTAISGVIQGYIEGFFYGPAEGEATSSAAAAQ